MPFYGHIGQNGRQRDLRGKPDQSGDYWFVDVED